MQLIIFCYICNQDGQGDKDDSSESSTTKPPYSYVALISMAIKDSQEQKLLVSRCGVGGCPGVQ